MKAINELIRNTESYCLVEAITLGLIILVCTGCGEVDNPTSTNEAPTSIVLSAKTVSEDTLDGTTIATLSGSDPDGDILSFTLLDNAGGRFKISGDELQVADGALLDHETAISHSITIQASDGSLGYSDTFTIEVTRANQAPASISLSARTVSEGASDNTIIGEISGTDPDGDTLSFDLLDDAGGRFRISGADLQLADSSSLDFETATSQRITVEASDGSRTYSESFTIYVIPQVDLRVGPVITVTTDSDAMNGYTTNVNSLIESPGSDGISLREAVAASNNTPGPETIEFSPELKGAVIYVGSSVSERLVLCDGELIINGDIDGDGKPDITLDGSLAPQHVSSGLTIGSSHNTVHALNIVDFTFAGIMIMPLTSSDCTERILYGNKIVRNIVSGTPGAGITTVQPGMGKDPSSSGIGWEDTLIAENVFMGNMNASIFLMAAFGGGSRNHIFNSIVVKNDISGATSGINIYAGDTASDWYYHPPEIRSLVPVVYSDDNVIAHTLIVDNIIEDSIVQGIHVASSGTGNRGNVVQDLKIVGNTILRAEQSLLVFVAPADGSRATTDNRVSEVEIAHNIIEDTNMGILLGVADGIGPPDLTISGTHDDINNNQLLDVLVEDNRIANYQFAGLFVWGGKTDSEAKTYNMSSNAAQRLIIRDNEFLAAGGGETTGILVIAGWGHAGKVTGNSIEDLEITNNLINDDNVAIWLIGGKDLNAENNRIVTIALDGNTGVVRIEDNVGGATGNTVVTPVH